MKVSRSIRWIVFMLIALFVAPLVVSATPPAGPTARVDPRALQAVAQGEGTFWVVLRDKADLSPAYTMHDWNARGRFVVERLQAAANASQAGMRALLKARGKAHQPFWIVNAIKVTADRATLDELARRADVDEITVNEDFSIPDPLPGQEEGTIDSIEWNINSIRAPLVWSSYNVRGSGIVVANIDTGVLYTHAALVRQYRGNQGNGVFDHNYNWYDPTGTYPTAPGDDHGHGTHTMGTMVGDDGGASKIGVAPSAKWIAVKGCAASGSCLGSNILSAGQWVLAPCPLGVAPGAPSCDATRRPNIVNSSWGFSSTNTTYRSMVQSWVAAGIFPVFSNGNSGPACNTVVAPASYPESYGVGAYDSSNTIANFSSRGASPIDGGIKPNISAPGVNIRSSWNNGSYIAISGTSMAAPHAAGTVALMWSAEPSLIGNIIQTRALLDRTAINKSDLSCGGTDANNNVWGEGQLDAYAAVTAAQSGTLSGTVWDASSGQVIVGATVTATTGSTTYSATTNSSGVYQMTLLRGTYSVTASASGYTGQTVSGVVVSSGATTTQDFSLTAVPTTGTLSGTVTNASTGAAIPGATVTATIGSTTYSTTTNASGQYSIILPPGTYSVMASKTGYTSQTKSAMVSAGTTTIVDFSLTAAPITGTLTGTVRDAGNNNTIPNATVKATIGSTTYSTTTDATGRYSMTLPGGSYSVTASKSGYISQTKSATVSNGSTTTLNFSLTPNGTLSGTVTNASTGAAIAGATVKATIGSTTYSTTTNTSGQYSMNVVPGSYSVMASKTGYTSQTKSATVSSGTTTTLNFSLTAVSSNGTLIGTVRDSYDDSLLAGATVKATIGSTTYSVTTNSSGQYSISLPAGTYSVTASMTGYYLQTVSVTVSSGATTTQNFWLDERYSDPCPLC